MESMAMKQQTVQPNNLRFIPLYSAHRVVVDTCYGKQLLAPYFELRWTVYYACND